MMVLKAYAHNLIHRIELKKLAFMSSMHRRDQRTVDQIVVQLDAESAGLPRPEPVMEKYSNMYALDPLSQFQEKDSTTAVPQEYDTKSQYEQFIQHFESEHPHILRVFGSRLKERRYLLKLCEERGLRF